MSFRPTLRALPALLLAVGLQAPAQSTGGWKSAGTLSTVLPEDTGVKPRLACVLRMNKREYLADLAAATAA